MDCTVVVAPLLSVSVATKEDAHQPAVSSAPDDLSRLSRQTISSQESGTQLAHRHCGRRFAVNYLGERMADYQSAVLWGRKGLQTTAGLTLFFVLD